MSISGISSATGVSLNQITSNNGSASVPAGSGAAKSAGNHSGGTAPTTTSAPAASTAGQSSASDLIKLKRLASEHMSVGSIAQQLGKSVSAVMQEAAAAGINLNAKSSNTSATTTTSSNSSATTTASQAAGVGNNVDVKA